jgi:hypothetical protein
VELNQSTSDCGGGGFLKCCGEFGEEGGRELDDIYSSKYLNIICTRKTGLFGAFEVFVGVSLYLYSTNGKHDVCS